MPAPDLTLLLDAARGAGEIAQRYWRQEPEVWEKDHGAGPVSEADLAVNDFLRDHLTGARPNYGWLSEESPDEPSRLDATSCFIVDPIDGTRAFIDGQQGFSHSLAVTTGDRVTAAVVHLPILGLTYAAVPDGPATLNGQPIHVREATLQTADILAGRPVMEPGFWRDHQPPPFKRSFRPSLAWRLCLVAEGRFDATLSFRAAWEWDIAAGSLIAERAGARVTNRHGRAMQFNSPEARVDGIVIAAPALHAELCGAMVAPIRPV